MSFTSSYIRYCSRLSLSILQLKCSSIYIIQSVCVFVALSQNSQDRPKGWFCWPQSPSRPAYMLLLVTSQYNYQCASMEEKKPHFCNVIIIQNMFSGLILKPPDFWIYFRFSILFFGWRVDKTFTGPAFQPANQG